MQEDLADLVEYKQKGIQLINDKVVAREAKVQINIKAWTECQKEVLKLLQQTQSSFSDFSDNPKLLNRPQKLATRLSAPA